MKKIKRLVAIALAAVMVMALAMPSFAAGTSDRDTGSITINGLAEGVTAHAYQIAEATYDEDGNFLGYAMTVSGDFDFVINSDGSYPEGSLTEANLAALWSAVSSAETNQSGEASVGSGNDYAIIAGLPVGAYLIVITGSESVAYGMMIGSVSYDVDENGNWIIDNGSFVVQDCELWAKATTPTVEKTEHHGTGSDTHGESANAGDEITFDITVSPIPSYQGEHPEFYVDDTLTGLTITDAELASITVSIINSTTGEAVKTLVKDTDYTITKVDNEEEFIVDFVVNDKYTLNDYAGETYAVVIEYQATVLDTEAYEKGESEHDNDAVLHYATTSYTVGDDGINPPEGTDEDETYEYTFTLNAEKTDSDSNALAGATFALFTDEDCSTAYTQDDKAVTAVSGEDGVLSFSGLAEGTYYMKETEAPAGYLLNTAVYEVVISATYNEDGSIASWSIVITLDGEQVASATQSADTGLTIINTKTGILPSTGGRGTLIFTIIGCAIVACAVIGVVATRRRRAA